MGAAASMKMIYAESLLWFRQYFDEMTYAEDFHDLDKNGDGGISFDELRAWLKGKADSNASWKLIISNQSTFRAAHMFACLYCATPADLADMDRILGLESFKQFLMHLFVLSILWVHFKHADAWTEGNDAGNERLSYDEFRMACRTFVSAQANEGYSDEKMEADFKLLDLDGSGTIEFIEVCTYCSKFIDTEFASKFLTPVTPASAHTSFMVLSPEDELEASRHRDITATTHTGVTSEHAELGALDAIAEEVKKNEHIAEFEQIKINTEVALGVF